MFFRKKEILEESVKLKKKEEPGGEEWDKRKIIISSFFAIVAILVLAEIKGIFFPSNQEILGESISRPTPIKKPDIKPPSFDVAAGVGSKIEDIKKNIEGLDAEEVASSSPQIQKVLRDIQGIKDLPTNQAREMCFKICSGI
ncbi:MAG: hypothetical protein HYW63_01445 [Candidatus Levybacteria bacterium]|nr:hypothetical protein [Candidatus Levybacteria bacterium]